MYWSSTLWTSAMWWYVSYNYLDLINFPHCILEYSISVLRMSEYMIYSDIPREKRQNFLQTVETLIRQWRMQGIQIGAFFSTENFIFLLKNICCGYAWEVSHHGLSNEYLQHNFCGEIRKKYWHYGGNPNPPPPPPPPPPTKKKKKKKWSYVVKGACSNFRTWGDRIFRVSTVCHSEQWWVKSSLLF